MFTCRNRTALVTGASSGIGAVFARELAARGMDVVLVARSEGRLRSLADELRGRLGVAVTVVAADLSRADAPRQVFEATHAAGLTVDLLVNNAGFSTHGDFDAIPAGRDHEQVMVNVAAPVALAHLYLPGMRRRGGGAVVNVASTAAFYPLAHQAVYGATKAFVLSFSEALWAENRGGGVHVLALCPGATRTEFFDTVGKELAAPMHTPEFVVKTGLRALEEGRRSFVIPGAQNYVESALLPRLLPRALFARFVARMSRIRWNDAAPAAAA